MRMYRITESRLRGMIREAVMKMINEQYEDRPLELGKQLDDNYYGGGLPDSYFSSDAPDDGRNLKEWGGIAKKLSQFADSMYDIANDSNGIGYDACEYVEKAAEYINSFIQSCVSSRK